MFCESCASDDGKLNQTIRQIRDRQHASSSCSSSNHPDGNGLRCKAHQAVKLSSWQVGQSTSGAMVRRAIRNHLRLRPSERIWSLRFLGSERHLLNTVMRQGLAKLGVKTAAHANEQRWFHKPFPCPSTALCRAFRSFGLSFLNDTTVRDVCLHHPSPSPQHQRPWEYPPRGSVRRTCSML